MASPTRIVLNIQRQEPEVVMKRNFMSSLRTVLHFSFPLFQRHSMLKQQDLSIAMVVTSREVLSAFSQLVPCVGCRRSVERLFSQLVESGNPALEPLTVGPKGVLSVTRSCMTDAKKLYTLFYVHG